MTPALDTLLRIAGPSLSAGPAVCEPEALTPLLSRRNGFYAFESALHMFSAEGGSAWNEDALWRHLYGDLTHGHYFFAEDVFGGQFSVTAEGIASWDPETGDSELLATDLEGWAQLVLTDYAHLTGHPLASEWQGRYGALQAGQRLLPRVPFVAGGEFHVDNLSAADAASAMRTRAAFADAIRDIPDGGTLASRQDARGELPANDLGSDT